MAGKNKAFNVLIVLAVLMAGVTLLLVFWMIRAESGKAFQKGRTAGLEEASKAAPASTVAAVDTSRADTLVARQDIPPGTVVLQEMVEVKQIPQDVRPPNSLAKFEELNGRMTAYFISTGDILLPSKLRTAEEIQRASYLVEQGKRYFSLPINPEMQGVAGMLRIGDRVDILATYDNQGTFISKIIIQNIRVIDVVGGDAPAMAAPASNPGVAAENPRPRLGSGSTITFEVTPEDAELFKALETSNLNYSFILRNINDDETVQTQGKTSEDVISAIAPARPKPVAVQEEPSADQEEAF